MFDDLRQAFREAVNNFKDEIGREDVPEAVDKLLRGMISEVTDAKARLSALESQIDVGGKRLEQENAELATCQRREKMALDIGDAETAKVAADFGAKHEERIAVLTKKVDAIQSEASLLRREIDDMMGQLKEARTRRDGLAAEAGRTGARESIGGSKDLFDDFDRMESRVTGDEADVEAWEEVSQATSEYSIDLDEPIQRPQVDFEARLEELKRRMKEQ